MAVFRLVLSTLFLFEIFFLGNVVQSQVLNFFSFCKIWFNIYDHIRNIQVVLEEQQ